MKKFLYTAFILALLLSACSTDPADTTNDPTTTTAAATSGDESTAPIFTPSPATTLPPPPTVPEPDDMDLSLPGFYDIEPQHIYTLNIGGNATTLCVYNDTLEYNYGHLAAKTPFAFIVDGVSYDNFDADYTYIIYPDGVGAIFDIKLLYHENGSVGVFIYFPDDVGGKNILFFTIGDKIPIYRGRMYSYAHFELSMDGVQLYDIFSAVLGSYIKWQFYRFADDLSLIPPDDIHRWDYDWANNMVFETLTAKVELDVEVNDGSGWKKAKIPAGTIVSPRYCIKENNNATSAICVFDIHDGKTYRLTVDYEPSSTGYTYNGTINGIPESDALDGIIYAGPF